MRTVRWKSLVASLLAVVVASCSYFAGYQHGNRSAGDDIDDTSVTSVTYPVRDLIVSWDPERTEPEYASLIQYIQSEVLRDSPNATHSIKADKKLMSLVVTHTKHGHEEVATLLSQLRSLHDQYTRRTNAGKCGCCGDASLPPIGDRCTGCGYVRHDPPQA